MDKLPENCIAKVVSLTSPKDACRLSLVATSFCEAAESDQVWEKFLPSDYQATQSLKQLYFWLSHHFLIIDQGTKSFSLEKGSGKVCYMLAARDLNIAGPEPGNTRRDWILIAHPDSRFGEVAKLLEVQRLEIKGKLNINLLSRKTTYTTFLVYNQRKLSAYGYKHVEVSVGITGEEETKTHRMILNYSMDACEWLARSRQHHLKKRQYLPPSSSKHSYIYFPSKRMWSDRSRQLVVPISALVEVDDDDDNDIDDDNTEVWEEEINEGLKPKQRGDGWWEIELGDYHYNDDGKDEDLNKELEMCLMGGKWGRSFIVQGIEIRPKLD